MWTWIFFKEQGKNTTIDETTTNQSKLQKKWPRHLWAEFWGMQIYGLTWFFGRISSKQGDRRLPNKSKRTWNTFGNKHQNAHVLLTEEIHDQPIHQIKSPKKCIYSNLKIVHVRFMNSSINSSFSCGSCWQWWNLYPSSETLLHGKCDFLDFTCHYGAPDF